MFSFNATEMCKNLVTIGLNIAAISKYFHQWFGYIKVKCISYVRSGGVVLKRNVVGRRFDNLSGSHLQSQVTSVQFFETCRDCRPTTVLLRTNTLYELLKFLGSIHLLREMYVT